jgi:hypothetical protein
MIGWWTGLFGVGWWGHGVVGILRVRGVARGLVGLGGVWTHFDGNVVDEVVCGDDGSVLNE